MLNIFVCGFAFLVFIEREEHRGTFLACFGLLHDFFHLARLYRYVHSVSFSRFFGCLVVQKTTSFNTAMLVFEGAGFVMVWQSMQVVLCVLLCRLTCSTILLRVI